MDRCGKFIRGMVSLQTLKFLLGIPYLIAFSSISVCHMIFLQSADIYPNIVYPNSCYLYCFASCDVYDNNTTNEEIQIVIYI